MRMRRKKNLEGRLADCGDYILYMDREDKNYNFKDTKNMVNYAESFGNDHPVTLEIGCGKGHLQEKLQNKIPI